MSTWRIEHQILTKKGECKTVYNQLAKKAAFFLKLTDYQNFKKIKLVEKVIIYSCLAQYRV